jgi:hypothetical protein
MRTYGFIAGIVAGSLLLLVGCSRQSTAPPTSASRPIVDDEHGHKPGSHGGVIVPIGRDSYHAEAVVVGDSLRLYILGADESRAQDVDSQDLAAFVAGAGGPVEIVLKPTPQPGDAPGRTSLFQGPAPKAADGNSITIPNLRIGGDRFRVELPAPARAIDTARALDGDEARALYLTPGGKYTNADIAANGNAPAAEKFKGFVSAHDRKPKSGDRICPVTSTKANPKFAWIVGGQRYEFCCPPCVDEFVRTAKEHPEEIKDPAEYTQK